MIDRTESTDRKRAGDAGRPMRRLVLLGASNVQRGLATAVAAAQSIWSTPLDVLAAAGNGRSYGAPSWFLGRELCGIVDCGLWRAWQERPQLPACALVTDVGNDVAYGYSAEQILEWVETCLRRIADRTDDVVVTLPPLDGLQRLGAVRFRILKTLFYPGKPVVFADALRRAEAVAAGLRQLAERYRAALVEPPPQWYGLDPIHVRLSHWSEAWRTTLGRFRQASASEPSTVRVSPRRWWRMQRLAAEDRRLFGMQRHRRQPCAALDDGTRISLY